MTDSLASADVDGPGVAGRGAPDSFPRARARGDDLRDRHRKRKHGYAGGCRRAARAHRARPRPFPNGIARRQYFGGGPWSMTYRICWMQG